MARLIQVLDQLPACTRACRESEGLSVETAAAEIGIPASVLHGFENGTDSRMQTVKRVVAWLEGMQSAHLERPVEIVVEPPAPRPAAHGPLATVEELVGDELRLEVESLRAQLAAAIDVIEAGEKPARM